MRLLESFRVWSVEDKRIELYLGDLTQVEPEEGFDLLVVSAFPDSYALTGDSLIGALARKGVSVRRLAKDKALDLRKDFSCWLSHEFDSPQPGIAFRRILCFEPRYRGSPPEVVGDIFRALAPILGDLPEIRSLAMPIVASGDQGYSVAEMLEPLLVAAEQWMSRGLPLRRLKIVAHSDVQAAEAEEIFRAVLKVSPDDTGSHWIGSSVDLEMDSSSDASAQALSAGTVLAQEVEPSTPPAEEQSYDVFISYARENSEDTDVFLAALQKARPDLKIFLDRSEIDVGMPWQPEIFENIDRCQKLVAILSPAYLSSKVCKEEYNIAWVRSREANENIIFPLYLYSADLPSYMVYRNYFDCREGHPDKLREASARLLTALDAACAGKEEPSSQDMWERLKDRVRGGP